MNSDYSQEVGSPVENEDNGNNLEDEFDDEEDDGDYDL